MIGLKTAKGTKQLKLDPSIYESLQKEKVEAGDVIYIEANSGAVKVCLQVTYWLSVFNVFVNAALRQQLKIRFLPQLKKTPFF